MREADVAKLNTARKLGRKIISCRPVQWCRSKRVLVNILKSLERSLDCLQPAEIIDEIAEGLGEACREGLECNQAAECQRALNDPQAAEAKNGRDCQPRKQRRNHTDSDVRCT